MTPHDETFEFTLGNGEKRVSRNMTVNAITGIWAIGGDGDVDFPVDFADFESAKSTMVDILYSDLKGVSRTHYEIQKAKDFMRGDNSIASSYGFGKHGYAKRSYQEVMESLGRATTFRQNHDENVARNIARNSELN